LHICIKTIIYYISKSGEIFKIKIQNNIIKGGREEMATGLVFKVEESTTFERVNKALEGVTAAASKLTNRAPLKKEQEENIDTTIIDTQQVTINAVAPTNNTGLKMEPLIVNLDIEGTVIDNDQNVVDEQPPVVQVNNNSIMIAKYPILEMLHQVIYKNNLDVLFTETPNMHGYIMGEVFENGIPNIQLSFTVDLEGNFMSPDKKIFIPNAKSDSPIAIELLNIELFTEIMSGKYINDDMTKFDLYTNEDKEINKLINLATLPELVDSINRNAVIRILLKPGFQTSLFNAKEMDQLVHFVFSEYKTPTNFKLISIDPNKPIRIVYNGKTASLTSEF